MKRHMGVLLLICSLVAPLAGGCNKSERAKEYQPPGKAETAAARGHAAPKTAADAAAPAGIAPR